MKYIKSFRAFFESKDPSMDDLNNFFRDFMSGNTRPQKNRNMYYFKKDEMLKYLQEHFFTKELLDKLAARGITDLDTSKIKAQINHTQYHTQYEYDYSDNYADRDNEKVNVNVMIEIPKGEEFIADNTVVKAFFWTSNVPRKKKEVSELYIKRLKEDDKEFNFYTVVGIIQGLYKEIIDKL